MTKAQDLAAEFESFLENKFQKTNFSFEGAERLQESVKYSLFNGGKRFRPKLCFATAMALGESPREVFEWAASVEMIHTYSLIHDDLPAMDNDDMRRGQPTNHKVYGDDIALLAGDALLTDAFINLFSGYSAKPELCAELVKNLSYAAGSRGMVLGQALDLRPEKKISENFLTQLHRLKTGALMSACMTGPALVFNKPADLTQEISKMGEELGLLFQIKDDVLDFVPGKEDTKNFCSLWGFEKTSDNLISLTHNLKNTVFEKFASPEHLLNIIDFNLNRTQ